VPFAARKGSVSGPYRYFRVMERLDGPDGTHREDLGFRPSDPTHDRRTTHLAGAPRASEAAPTHGLSLPVRTRVRCSRPRSSGWAEA
jgi:hypothetical protein